NQEGYHCVPLPPGPATPFCGPGSPGAVPNGTGGRPACVAFGTDPTCKYPPEALACQGSSPDPNCDTTCGFDGNNCCCVCQGCANICGDGAVESVTGEQCDSGNAGFIDPAHNYPDNYSTGAMGCVAPNGPTNCSFQSTDPLCGTGGAHLACCCYAANTPSGCTAPNGPTSCSF